MRTSPLLFALFFTPWIAAPKCIDADPYYVDASAPEDAGTTTSTDTPTVDAGRDGFVPARPCRTGPGVARIRVSNRQYVIDCGCAEASGRTCTVPAGTEVIWTFADSEEHDVASVGGSFGGSGEQLAGTWSARFDRPGAYPYLCNIHSGDMNGYLVIVQ